ncbi:hypothetical protein T484DRAFT_1780991, partial [Baffinella frigidus]
GAQVLVLPKAPRPISSEIVAQVLVLPKAPRPITCLNSGALDKNEELLMRGDEEGHIGLHFMKPGWTKVDGIQGGAHPNAWVTQVGFVEDLFKGPAVAHPNAWITQVGFVEDLGPAVAHPNAWVTQVGFVEDLGPAVVSSGTDSRLCLYDIESRKIKWKLEAHKAYGLLMSEPAHTKGIRTWDWSNQFNIFATAGLERE